MKKLRVGVVGLGHRGRHMIKLAAMFDCAEPAAACDLDERNWYEQQWLSDAPLSELLPGVTFYRDYDTMLREEKLDVILMETGADIHAEFCRKALELDINVLSDIPMVANLEEADFLWKAEQRSKAILSTGANPNEGRFSVLLKEFCDKGFLGKPYYMEAEYIHWDLPGDDENIHLNENGDWRKLLSPIRYCTHSLGPLLRLLDEDIVKVSCFGTGPHADDYQPDTEKDDMQCAQFQTPSGVVIRLMRNGRCRAKIGRHNLRVFGTEGYMERIGEKGSVPETIRFNTMLDNDNEMQEVKGGTLPPEYENNPLAEGAGHGGQDYAMMDHFLQAVVNGKPAPISLREGLAMTLPGIYAEESARRGGEVLSVRYPWDKDWVTHF